jgi:hypothetical protein
VYLEKDRIGKRRIVREDPSRTLFDAAVLGKSRGGLKERVSVDSEKKQSQTNSTISIRGVSGSLGNRKPPGSLAEMLAMLQVETRSLRDKGQPSSYEPACQSPSVPMQPDPGRISFDITRWYYPPSRANRARKVQGRRLKCSWPAVCTFSQGLGSLPPIWCPGISAVRLDVSNSQQVDRGRTSFRGLRAR